MILTILIFLQSCFQVFCILKHCLLIRPDANYASSAICLNIFCFDQLVRTGSLLVLGYDFIALLIRYKKGSSIERPVR